MLSRKPLFPRRRRRWWIALRLIMLVWLLGIPLSHFMLGTGSVQASNHIIYVWAAADGKNDGTNWNNAYTDLQTALLAAKSGQEIWVAAGVYKPTSNSADRMATFQLKNGVTLYGGFGGTETVRERRNWTIRRTILSGDIDNNDLTARGVVTSTADIVGANSYHVVTGSNTDGSAVLDGVIITAGQANGAAPHSTGGGMVNNNGSPTLKNIAFSGNSASFGGGMTNNNSSPILSHATFSGNSASQGGAIYNSNSSPHFINVTFNSNYASNVGGGMRNITNSSPTLTNVTFSGNRADNTGGAMHNASSSSPTIQNSIFSNNQSSNGEDSTEASIVNVTASNPAINHSLLRGCNPNGVWMSSCGADGGNNVADATLWFVETPNPAKAPTTSGNLRLGPLSPAINKGKNEYNGSSTDLAGNVRKIGVIDLGAYERVSASCPTGGVRYVDQRAVIAGDGLSWNSAYRELQDALQVAEPCQIWVTNGIYKPTDSPTGRTATFRLMNNISIYGGFAGTETDPSQRVFGDRSNTLTVLSGDIDNNDITTSDIVFDAANIVGANSYHVLTSGSSIGNMTVLDHLLITAGLANGAYSSPCHLECGGGMYNSGSPTLNEIIFIGNKANVNGGGLFNWGSSSPRLTSSRFEKNHANIGGGMANENSSPTLTNVWFLSNKANSKGGGMGSYSNSSPTLTNGSFTNNSAAKGGGMSIVTNSNATLTNIIFQGNSAQSHGGGLSNEINSSAILINIAFDGNSAGQYGGGVSNQESSAITLINSAFSGNRANTNGGGLYNEQSAATIQNSIFWHNRASNSTGTADASIVNDASTTNILYSLVQGCKPGGEWNSAPGVCGTNGGNNQTDADPLFLVTPDPVQAPTFKGILILNANSPAIDQGNNAYINNVTTDLAGKPRIVGTAVDLGAYESDFVSINISANPTAGGTVSGGGPVAPGTQVTVTATANNGYTFVSWTEGGTAVSTSASYNFTATVNRTLVANFINSAPSSHQLYLPMVVK
jgi:predicted outer membrane repeat protein